MEITQKQFRAVYTIFVVLFAANLGVTVWNAYQDHKVRKELKNKPQDAK